MDSERLKKIQEVAERLKSPEAQARKAEAIKRAKERERKIMECLNITEEFLRRRVTF